MRRLLAPILCALLLAGCVPPPSPKDQLATLRSSFTVIEDTDARMSAKATLTTRGQNAELPHTLWLNFARLLAAEAKTRGHVAIRFDDNFTYSQRDYSGRGASPGVTRVVDRRLIASISVSSVTPVPEGFFAVTQPVRALQDYFERAEAKSLEQRQAQHQKTVDRLNL